ncbi:MAG: helix-turn-helix domain-containing protein [Ruminococcus sp.]|nr:helix-turn-helix domain-containing protein [Ruminococcus sp.]
MSKQISELIKVIRSAHFSEEFNQTSVPYMTVYHFTDDIIKMPQIDTSYIYLIVDGSMRLYTPSGIMDYIAGQYSVSKIDTPLSGKVLTFSEKADFLALSIEFTFDDVISVVLDIEGDLIEKIMNSKLSDEITTSADRNIIETITKLFVINNSYQLAFMANHLKREIIFYVLCSSCGKSFLQGIINISQSDEIYEANSWIKKNFKENFTIEELAKKRNMSVSNFHQKFKNAVGMGPLQCQKRLRLTEARRLMLDKNVNVTDASLEVGYESLSQFIRDYKRIFGVSPKTDVQNLKKQLRLKI